jgi:uncharacterized RmlC-like cupin family protein
MRERWTRRAAAALALCAALAGCGDGTGAEPLRLEGRWTAIAANGQQLPANAFSYGPEVGWEEVVEAEMEAADGMLTLQVVAAAHGAALPPAPLPRFLSARYEVSGDVVTISNSALVHEVEVAGGDVMTLYADVPVHPATGRSTIPVVFVLTRDE